MNNYYIGQEVSIEKEFVESDVMAFSKITGDVNPLHLDSNFARKSRFGAPVVHGMFIAGVISNVVGTRLPGKGSIYLEQNLKFLKPVYVGESVIVRVKIIDILWEKRILYLETNVYDKSKACKVCGNAEVLYEGDF